MVKLINLIGSGVPKLLTEIIPWAGRSRIGPSTCWTTSTYRCNQQVPRAPTRLSPPIPKPHPTTSPDHCSKLADSDPDYTLNCEELRKRLSQLDGMVR